MKAFRLLALGYALLALLIAPTWIAADDHVAPQLATDVVEDPAAAVEPALETAGKLAGGREDGDGTDAAAEPDAAEVPDAEQPAASQPPKPKPQKPDGEPSAKPAQSGSVTITDFEFTPATITVNVGDTVTWTNQGPTMHTATAEDGSFDTGNLDRGESGSATFNSPGTIAYICTPHPFMKGTVVVRSASSGTGGGTGGGGGSGSSGDSGAGDPGDADALAGTGSGSSGSGSGLPATGLELLAIALLGAATLAAGLLLRRRSEA